MRCGQCNKFVSYDEPTLEVQDASINGTTLEVNVTATLPCADCGSELSQCEMHGEAEVEHECAEDAKVKDDWNPEEDDDKFELEGEPELEATERMETKDRRGKPIRNPRYMKKYYGFSADAEVTCKRCGATFTVEVETEEQASSFESCQ